MFSLMILLVILVLALVVMGISMMLSTRVVSTEEVELNGVIKELPSLKGHSAKMLFLVDNDIIDYEIALRAEDYLQVAFKVATLEVGPVMLKFQHGYDRKKELRNTFLKYIIQNGNSYKVF